MKESVIMRDPVTGRYFNVSKEDLDTTIKIINDICSVHFIENKDIDYLRRYLDLLRDELDEVMDLDREYDLEDCLDCNF